MRAHWVDDESGRIGVSQPYSLDIGCIPANWSYPDPELALLAAAGTDNPTLRMYLADPGHPMWKGSPPFELPSAAVMLVDVETVQFRLTVRPDEPISEPPGDWDEIEQGGADFGATPRYIGTPSDRQSPSDPPTTPLPVAPDLLASIADGWNMIRVYSRSRYPFSTETEIAIDIWPIDGPADREVLHRQPRSAPRTTSLRDGDAALTLPSTDASLLVRTDFTSNQTWWELVTQVRQPVEEIPDAQFAADVETVDDIRFDRVSTQDLIAAARRSPAPPRYLFVADTRTLTEPDRLVLALDLEEQPGRELRIPPTLMWSIENNLSLGNMDFSDFASAATAGVFRGF